MKFFIVGDQILFNGDEGIEIIPNTTDASFEKHIPVVYQERSEIHVKVGSEEHPMDNAHYIKWIAIESVSGSYQKKELTPDDKPETVFTSPERVVVAYALCNLHGLWKSENVACIEHRTI